VTRFNDHGLVGLSTAANLGWSDSKAKMCTEDISGRDLGLPLVD
jgi:hypothetical protein